MRAGHDAANWRRRDSDVKRISLQTSIDVARPAAEVFDFVADQTNAPLWQEGLYEARRVTPGPIGVGTEHEFVRRFAGMKIKLRNRFTSHDPGRFVSFEIPSGKITGEASYLAEAIGTDTSRLTSTVRFDMTGLFGLAAPILAWLFERQSRRDEARLKELLERDDNASPAQSGAGSPAR
jgi:Polyketide cyclase / dehydrase and lipid transport